MDFKFNKEGTQYMLGLPLRGNPTLFSQVVLSADELELMPSEVTITGFSSFAEAQRAKEELYGYLGESPCIYQVTINCLRDWQI